MSDFIHVAVGVIIANDGSILLAKRPAHVHQGGLWEFPGGKVNPGETVQQALERELKEELGIDVIDCSPLTEIRHQYPDKSVFLDVWSVTDYAGTAVGKEGQPLVWAAPATLTRYEFPEANQPIIEAIVVRA